MVGLTSHSGGTVTHMAASSRFLLLADVAEILNTSSAQVYALVRRKELKAMKLGGRGQWRVRPEDLDAYVEEMYHLADRFIDEHPFAEKESVSAPEEPAVEQI